jgi:hypothetical protein
MFSVLSVVNQLASFPLPAFEGREPAGAEE